MRLLLDTHVFLWWVSDAPELSAQSREVIADQENECFLSMASGWEMAIKASLGKLQLPQPAGVFLREQIALNGFRLLPIELAHVEKVERLPFHHRDPFDRLRVAQALTENLEIVSADAVLAGYGLKCIW